jgi:hypothetical protein
VGKREIRAVAWRALAGLRGRWLVIAKVAGSGWSRPPGGAFRAPVVEHPAQSLDLLLVELGIVDRVVRLDFHPALNAFPPAQLLESAPQMREVFEVLALGYAALDDAIGRPHSSSRMVTFLPFGVGQ